MKLGPVRNFLLITTILVASGCVSATKRIATQSNEIAQNASEISNTADRAIASLQDPPPSLILDAAVQAYLAQQMSYWLSARNSASQIIPLTQGINEDLTKVEDSIPWWATLLKFLAGLGILAIVAGVLFYTGILTAIQKFVWGLGKLIPSTKKSQAKLASEAIARNPENPELNAAIAFQRAKDPAFDAAYRNLESNSKV